MHDPEKGVIFDNKNQTLILNEDYYENYEGCSRKNTLVKKIMAVRVQWVWSMMWLFVLIGIVWPISLVACIFYILIIPFTACCECTNQLTEFIHKGIVLPQVIAVYMVAGRSCEGL